MVKYLVPQPPQQQKPWTIAHPALLQFGVCCCVGTCACRYPDLQLYSTVFHVWGKLNRTFDRGAQGENLLDYFDQYVKWTDPSKPNFLQVQQGVLTCAVRVLLSASGAPAGGNRDGDVHVIGTALHMQQCMVSAEC
jgi:hypothetical protein